MTPGRGGAAARAGRRGSRSLDLINTNNSPNPRQCLRLGPWVPCLVAFPEGQDEAVHRAAVQLISGVVIEPFSSGGLADVRTTG